VSKPLPIRVVRRAAVEIADAVKWWRANRADAPDLLTSEIARAFKLIRSQPSIGAVARNAALPGVRRVYLGRVRYHIYYRLISPPEAVEVLAFWHSSRGTGPSL
jgi:plasmid stabilization system protein ParE